MPLRGRGEIELIARGACVKAGMLLLCHSKGAWNTYLPGGHVDFGEAAARGLGREFAEELGVRCRVGRFLGAVEHAYRRKGELQCEVNLVFRVEVPGIAPPRPPRSREDFIEFLWAPLARLGASSLEPKPLRALLPRWLKRRGPEPWASTC